MEIYIIKSGESYLSPNGKLKVKVLRRPYSNSISYICHCSVLEGNFWHSREIFSNQDVVDTGQGLVFFEGKHPAKAIIILDNKPIAIKGGEN